MEQELVQQELKPAPRKTQKRKKIVLTGVSVAIWCGLLLAGFYFANNYIKSTQTYLENRLDTIEKTNQQHIDKIDAELEKLYDEMLNIKSELVFIQEDLSLTGEALDGTNESKVALQERIKKLDKQLQQLQQSIARLEDAAR